MATDTKKGRRTTGHDAVATIRLSSELRESVDAWAAKQSDKPARPKPSLGLSSWGLKRLIEGSRLRTEPRKHPKWLPSR
jgi:hypothetical protein